MCGSAGVLNSPCSLFRSSWALQHLVPLWHSWQELGEDRICGAGGSQDRTLPTFPLSFPSARLQVHPHPLLCSHTFGISDGFAPSEGDPCPVPAHLQSPCVFLSWGSAQLWLLPVPLPYTLTATHSCSFAHTLCNNLKAPSPKFGGNPRGHSAIYQKKKREKELTCTVFLREI